MKKKLSLSAAILIATNLAFSQGTAINTNGATADGSAMLDVSSTTQGMLIPRMTETNRVNITSPATGLMVYQTDVVKGFYYFSGTAWTYIGADNLGNHTATQQLDMDTNKVINVATCTDNLDAANKLYVDGKVGAGGGPVYADTTYMFCGARILEISNGGTSFTVPSNKIWSVESSANNYNYQDPARITSINGKNINYGYLIDYVYSSNGIYGIKLPYYLPPNTTVTFNIYGGSSKAWVSIKEYKQVVQ